MRTVLALLFRTSAQCVCGAIDLQHNVLEVKAIDTIDTLRGIVRYLQT